MTSEQLHRRWEAWIIRGLWTVVISAAGMLAAIENYSNVGLVLVVLSVAWIIFSQFMVRKYRKLTNAAWANDRKKLWDSHK